MKEYQAIRMSDEKFILGEGPVYNQENGVLTWVDIKTGTLHGLEPDGNRFQIQTGQYLGAALPIKGKEAYLAVMTTGIYRVCKNDIHLEYSLKQEFKDFQRANDAKCDPQGRLWFGSMPLFFGNGDRGGDIYTYTNHKQCRKVIKGTMVANGMAWTDKLFYYVDSGKRQVCVCDYVSETGEISNERIALCFEDGIPDGMTIDAEGMLWVAKWGQGIVGRYDPVTGEMLSRIVVPAKQVSSCCFGGKDRDVLYITSSGEEMAGDQDGCLFSCRTDVAGMDNGLYIE